MRTQLSIVILIGWIAYGAYALTTQSQASQQIVEVLR